MTAILLTILPVVVGSIGLWLVAYAPEGYEDNFGFHLGPEPVPVR